MLKSMTGFGRSEGEYKSVSYALEIRSVNSRYPDIQIYTPRVVSFLEAPIRDKLVKSALRGKIHLSLNLSGDMGIFSEFKLNESLLSGFLSIADELKNTYKLAGEVNVYNILTKQELVGLVENETIDEEFSSIILQTLDTTIKKLEAMEYEEGKFIQEHFVTNLQHLKDNNILIKNLYKENITVFIEKLQNRVQRLLIDSNVEADNLRSEIVVLGDKLDISEEIDRFESHLLQFDKYLFGEDYKIGKRLNFLLQEMNREVTTMGNKANSAEISQIVVEMKNAIEMIREQVQNIQ